MAISCDHPRPKLVLPSYTPPKLNWQVPALLPGIEPNSARAILEALRGIYNEMLKRFAEPTIVPLIEDMQARPGQVIKGVGAGQTITLVPPGPSELLDPVVIVLTALSSPVTVAMPDGTVVTLSTPGVYTVLPDSDGSYQVPPGDVGLVGIQAISAGTQLASAGTVSFSNSNGITFGMAGSSIVTASASPQLGLVSHIGGNSVSNVTQLAFSNASNITWSLSTAAGAATVIASAGAGGSSSAATEGIILDPTEVLNFVRTSGTWDLETSHIDSDGALGSTTTAAAVATTALATAPGALDRTIVECTIYCSSAGTFSVTAGGVTVLGPLSLTAGERVEFTSAQGWRVFNADGSEKSATGGSGGGIAASAAGNSVSLGTVIWSNSNNVSFGMAGSTITATATFASSQGIINFSAGTTSTNASNIVFSNANNVSFGLNGATVTASATVAAPAATREIGIVSHIGGNVVSSVSLLAFSNASNVTFSLSTAANAATVIASVAVGGGGLTNINVSAGTTSQNLSNLVFSNSNGVSFGLNGSTVTASVAAAGGGITYSGFSPILGGETVLTSLGFNTWLVFPLGAAPAFQFDRLVARALFSNATNATNSNTLRLSGGIYTRNGNTLSLVNSSSTSFAFTGSGTVGNYSLVSGQRDIDLLWTSTLAASNYWLGVGWSVSTAGNSSFISSNQFGYMTQNFSVAVGKMNAATNSTIQQELGQGFFSVSSTVAPVSMAISNIIGSGLLGWRAPAIRLVSGTV